MEVKDSITDVSTFTSSLPVNCLNRSRKGVLRLMDAGLAGAQNRQVDGYWQNDVNAMTRTMEECTNLLNSLSAGNSNVAEQAKGLRQPFADLVTAVKNPPNMDTAARIEVAARFFTMAAQIYTLAEMAQRPAPQR